MTARHGCHTCVVPTTHPTVCPHDSFSPHLSIARPFCLSPPSRARVPHPVFHVKHIRTPVRLPPPPLSTFRSPVLPHTPPTAPVRRSEALSPPTQPNSTHTPLQGPHRAFQSPILKMAATSATSTVMSHTIRPKNALNGRQKPCWPFRADFTPCGVLGMSRPDPCGGRPRVKPVSLPFFSTVRDREWSTRTWFCPVVVTCRDVGSPEVAARKLRRPLAVLPTRGVGALRVAWPRTRVRCAHRAECRDATRPMWRSPSRGSCHPRDTLVACHHMGWVCGWFWLVSSRVVDGGGCFSLFSF